ncbi:MAG: CPBP family intramembrane glutamic endopeptidase [Sulfurimonadaceae bacterium]
MNKTALLVEFFLIFICPPLLIVWGLLPKEAIMPVLWVVSLYAYLLLRSSGVKVLAIDFEREALYAVLKRFVIIAAVMTLFVLLYKPEIFLALVKTEPWRWLAVMLFYPVFSAFIQEVLFRNFFFYRYEKLFEGRMLLLVTVNALLFAYVHIVFENWIAVIFTFFGGLLFAQTYLKTRSTLLTAIEHSLYGNTLYTLGLGYYFYHGTNI